jgi:hypothetical protein
MGFPALEVVNLFARIATDPVDLASFADPIGAGNDDAILEAARGAGLTIAAWGVHGKIRERGANVAAMLRREGVELFALGITKDGMPRHPLYLRSSAEPFSIQGGVF